MFSLTELRRLGPLLLGLILLAQAVAIIPLISIHIQHAFENAQDIAADLAEGSQVDHVHHHHAHSAGGGHEHGASDPNDPCCTLHHHLTGVLPIAGNPRLSDLTAPIVPVPPRSLSSADPGALERPPKLPLSI
jgi:hypothetical protein